MNGTAIWARLSSGAPDPSFGDNGFVHHPVDGLWSSASALAGDQRLFLVGKNANGVQVLSVKLQPDPLPLLPGVPTARAKITSPTKSRLKRSKLKRVTGTASALNGSVSKVEVAIFKSGPRKSKRCIWLKSNKAKFRSVRKTKAGCKRQVWLRASGKTKWSLKLRKSLPIGKYTIYARAVPVGGTPEARFTRSLRNLRTIKLSR